MNKLTIGYIQALYYADEHYLMMLLLLPEFRSKDLWSKLLVQIKDNATFNLNPALNRVEGC